MITLQKLILVAVTAIALTACGSAVPLKDNTHNTVDGKVVDNRPPEPPRPCCVNPDGPERDPLDDPGVLAHRTIYFDFDSYSFKEEFRPLIEAHAKYLINHPKRSVVLTGHTDIRGGSEYNLALGDKRAEAVRRMLILLGASPDRLETASYGKEKPVADGDDEASWALNRRVELEYRPLPP